MFTGQSLRGLMQSFQPWRINVVLADGAHLHLRFHRGSHLSPTSAAPRSGAKNLSLLKTQKHIGKTERDGNLSRQSVCSDTKRDAAKTPSGIRQRQRATCLKDNKRNAA